MIMNPVVSGGAGSSAWKEVDRGYIAEHTSDQDANFLVAVFTTDFPDQPMIIPASWVFSIGMATPYKYSACTYKGALQEEEGYKTYYVYSIGQGVSISTDPDGSEWVLDIGLYDSSGEYDIIPEGWSIKYYIYEE